MSDIKVFMVCIPVIIVLVCLNSSECILTATKLPSDKRNPHNYSVLDSSGRSINIMDFSNTSINANSSFILLKPHHIHVVDEIEIFDNATSKMVASSSGDENLEFAKQIDLDSGRGRNYRKRTYGGAYGGYGGGTYSYAGTYGGGGAGVGYGAYGGGHKKGHPNSHYNPSVNKYGGGGPLSHNNPSSGHSPPPLKPNYGHSYIPNNLLPALGGGGGNKGPSGTGGVGGEGGTNFGGSRPGSGTRPLPPISGSGSGGGNGIDFSEDSVTIVICEIGENCKTFTHCASYSSDYLGSKDRCCIQPRKQVKGMCCEGGYSVPENPGRNFNPYSTSNVQVPDISQSSLQTAAAKGYEYHSTYRTIENRLLELNIIVEKGTSAHGHLQFFQTTPAIINAARDNFFALKASSYIQDSYFLTNAEAGIGLQGYDFGGTVLEKTCTPTPKCDQFSKYRTADGSCNNPISAKLGQSTTPLIRLLPPDYSDGIWAPRVRKDGSPLPSARFITLNLVPDANLPDLRYSHMLMQFGQFVDHDLSHVPIMRFPDLSGIQCCSSVESDVSHPACFPIDIPPNDLHNRGQPCMNFVRSMTAPRLDCSFGHADQLNQLTHWLDASQIYGSTFEAAESLREFSGGRLRISRENGREFLPEDSNENDRDCAANTANAGNGHCFIAGDKRVNENIALTSLQTIFLREHNRICFELATLNPHWEDETLYQEARRIVIAEYQHILYNEWLPIIIGRNYMETFGILPLYEGYFNGYDSGVDGRVSTAFTTAAFRLHTLVQGTLNLQSVVGGGGSIIGRLVLRDFFNNPSLLPEVGVLDSLTEGLLTQPIQRFDNYVTTELRDHLFETANSPGMDLIALNIQRGRDHGLPSYNEYRDLCRLGKARDFDDLAPVIHPRKIPQLERIYGNVDDIDLFIGGIHESPLPGAVVGPTFACIIGDQFVRSKRGDQYFYDVGGHPHSFSKAQLHEIRSASLSRILCDNSDEIRAIQPLAFHLPHRGYNPIIPCGSPAIPRLDLRAWRE